MSILIYYFSGTGNSLYVAREIAKELPDSKIIPVVANLNQDKIKVYSEIVGFVFPNFCLSLPIPMQMFLNKVDLISSKYLFAICTRGGTTTEAFEYIDILLKKQNKKLNAKINITMPWNHPLGKKNMTSEANLNRLDNHKTVMKQKLDIFMKSINLKEDYDQPDIDADYQIPKCVKILFTSKTFNYESHRYMYQNLIKFYVDSKCIGCGICEKVCLSNKIEIKSGKPYWNNRIKCFGCFACINYCRQKAIQIKSRFPIFSHTYETGRYHNPEVSSEDIEKQN